MPSGKVKNIQFIFGISILSFRNSLESRGERRYIASNANAVSKTAYQAMRNCLRKAIVVMGGFEG